MDKISNLMVLIAAVTILLASGSSPAAARSP